MYSVSSSTITEDSKANEVPLQEWLFQISNGNTGKLVISDPLLDTTASATERAKSEFLKNSYKVRSVTFSTYRTDIEKNMTINVRGLPYLVKSIGTSINQTSIKTLIKAIRYE